MTKKCLSTFAIVALQFSAAFGGTDYYFGNFEEDVQFNGQYITDRSVGAAGGFRGWFDWPFDSAPLITSASPSTQFGVTTGQYSIAWRPSPPSGGFHQGLAVNLQNLPAATRDAAFQAFLDNTHIAMNVTWNNDEWFDAYNGDGWNGAQVSMAINYGPTGAYTSQGFPDIDTGNPSTTGHWDLANYPGVHNRIVQWDYSALKPAIQALYTAGTLNETNGWLEFLLETNMGNFTQPVTFYIDSWRFTDNIDDNAGLNGDFNDDGAVDAADYVVYRKNEGTTNTLPNDDGIGGTVGTAHYDLWSANFGASAEGAGSGTSAVPEPSTLTLLACGLGLWMRRRRSE